MKGRDKAAPEGGRWDKAFAPLAELFLSTVAAGEERGGLAVLLDGRLVVDIRGGLADPRTGRPWTANTLACCFSVTKGVLSLLAHRLIDKGLFGLDTTVAALWPEFAANGKERITVADVLTHRAGLPAVSVPCARGDLYDWDRMTGLIAASAPAVPPRDAPVYHNMTYGYLLGEIFQRAGGQPLSALLRQELTGPLGADFCIGLTAAEQKRAAHLSQDDPASLFRALETEPDTLFSRSMAFFDKDEDFNTPRWRRASIGSGSGHATAPALAKLYAQFLPIGSLLSPARRADALAECCRSAGADPILGVPIRYACGLELSTPPGLDFGPNPRAVGYWGAGGATAFTDPDAGLSFGYVTGIMAPQLGSSKRARALIGALYDCL